MFQLGTRFTLIYRPGKITHREIRECSGIPLQPETHLTQNIMGFTRTWTVRFSDTDPFGIAHYPRMIDAIHETSEIFLEEIGWPFWVLTEKHGIGLPLVAMDFDFKNQVGGGDEVEIELIPDVRESSIRFEYRATHDGKTVFSGTEFRVCVPVDDDNGVPVPDDLGDALETGV